MPTVTALSPLQRLYNMLLSPFSSHAHDNHRAFNLPSSNLVDQAIELHPPVSGLSQPAAALSLDHRMPIPSARRELITFHQIRPSSLAPFGPPPPYTPALSVSPAPTTSYNLSNTALMQATPQNPYLEPPPYTPPASPSHHPVDLEAQHGSARINPAPSKLRSFIARNYYLKPMALLGGLVTFLVVFGTLWQAFINK